MSTASPAIRTSSPKKTTPSASTAIFTAVLLALVVLPLYWVSVWLAGPFYVLFFCAITWWRPAVGLMIAAAAAVFPLDVSGGPIQIALGELSVVLALPIILIKNASAGRRLRQGPILLPALAYLVVCILSSAIYWRGSSTLTTLFQTGLYLLVVPCVFMNTLESDESLLLVLYGYVASAAFLAASVVYTRSNYLYDIHKNNIGSTLACASIVCVELWISSAGKGRPILLKIAIIVIPLGLIISTSRGAWIGAAIGALFILLMRGRVKAALRVSYLLIPLVMLGWWLVPEERKEYAMGTTGESIEAREISANYALRQISMNPIIGVGLGLRKEYDATNIILATLAETGILGLGTFLWIQFAAFNMVWRSRRRVPPQTYAFSLLAIGGALMIAKVLHGCVDHYWGRGSLLIVYACVGLSSAVYLRTSVKQNR